MSENAQVLRSLVKEADVAIALKAQTAKSTSNAGWVQLASGQDFDFVHLQAKSTAKLPASGFGTLATMSRFNDGNSGKFWTLVYDVQVS